MGLLHGQILGIQINIPISWALKVLPKWICVLLGMQMHGIPGLRGVYDQGKQICGGHSAMQRERNF